MAVWPCAPHFAAAQPSVWSESLLSDAVLCEPTAFPAVVAGGVNRSLLSGGGCLDAGCVNDSHVICANRVNDFAAHDGRFDVVNGTGSPFRFAGPTALVTLLGGLYLVPACSFTAMRREPEYPDRAAFVADLNLVFGIDYAGRHGYATPASSPLRSDGTARVNASCAAVGQHLFIIGGLIYDSKTGTFTPTNTIDVVKFVLNVTVTRLDYFRIPAPTNLPTSTLAVSVFSEGFTVVQSTSQNMLAGNRLMLFFVLSGESLVDPEGDYVAVVGGYNELQGSAPWHYAVETVSNFVQELRDPFIAVAKQQITTSMTGATWTSNDAIGSVTTYGSTLGRVTQLSQFSGATVLLVLFGGCGNGRDGPGAPLASIQYVNMLTLPAPDFSVTPDVATVGRPFEVHLTSSAPSFYFFRLSMTVDCALDMADTVKYAAPLVFVPAFPSDAAYLCVSQGAVTELPVGAPAGFTAYFFTAVNVGRPFQVVLAQDTTTATAAASTTAQPGPSNVSSTTAAPRPPPATTNTIAPTAPVDTPAPSTGASSSAPTTAAPSDGSPAAGWDRVPLGVWVGAAVAVGVLLVLVGLLVVGTLCPSSKAGVALRRCALRVCGTATSQDSSIRAIAGSQLSVVRRIGSGGWGTVYLCQRGGCEPGSKDEVVAVKHVTCSRNVAKALVLREIRVLQGVQGHPNIVRVFEMVVREALEGGDDDRTARRRPATNKASTPRGVVDEASSPPAAALVAADGAGEVALDPGRAAVSTLHQAAAATYGFRTNGMRDRDNSAASFCDVESFGTGDFEDDDDDRASFTPKTGSVNDASAAAGAADMYGTSELATTRVSPAGGGRPSRRRRVHRFLCIVMRYYDKGDLLRWLSMSPYVLDESYNPYWADFPTLRAGALPIRESSSTVFDDFNSASAPKGSPPPGYWLAGPAGRAAAQDCPVDVVVRSMPPGFGPPLPEPLLLSIAVQLASVLNHLHNRGILHCDIKPQNVLVASDIAKHYLTPQRRSAAAHGGQRGRRTVNAKADTAPAKVPTAAEASRIFLPIVVTDFGVAQVISRDRMDKRARAEARDEAAPNTSNRSRRTRTSSSSSDEVDDHREITDSSPAGFTLPYLAPECVSSGMSEFGQKSDVWAMGCVLYGLATKQVLSGEIETAFMFERARRLGHRFPAAVAGDLIRVGYSRDCAELIARTLDPSPVDRSSAAKVLSDIVRVSPLRYAAAPPRRATAPDASATAAHRTPDRRDDGYSAPSSPAARVVGDPADLVEPLLEDC